jgi:chitin disaccharide deacetylase
MGEPAARVQASTSLGNKATADRRIWLVADDYGISRAVNAAIRDLLERGAINATSVMVVASGFDDSEAAKLNSLRADAAIGLHLTLTAPFRPLSEGYAPLHGGGFLSLRQTFLAAMLRRLSAAALTREIEAQVARFTAAFGRPPDFIDGHQHVHLFPQVRQAALETTSWIAPQAWMRQCGSRLPLRRRLTDPKGVLVDWLSREFRVRAKKLGIATNPAFAGTYSYRANADFGQIFPGFLSGLPAGSLVMCHPGHVDAELERLDPLTTLREREYAYFRGDAFPAALAAHDLALT